MMTAHYVLHPRDRYVEEVVEGDVTLAGMAELVGRVLGDPDFSPEFNGLVDFSRARIGLSYDEVAMIAGALANDARSSRGHWAFVVATDVGHGVVRMFEALSNDTIVVRIFRARAPAEAWLRSVAALGSAAGT